MTERIEAQLRARIAEAAELASLDLLVALRARAGRPAPVEGDRRDRDELAALAADFLVHLRDALLSAVAATDRVALEAAQQADTGDTRARVLAGHSWLARRLPDYWQRFDIERRAFAEQRLSAAGAERGWIRRMLGG